MTSKSLAQEEPAICKVVLRPPSPVSLAQAAELNPRRHAVPPEDADLVTFVPMRAVTEESGRMDGDDVRPWAEVKKGYTAFQNGDVIFAKITPCMENGKFALASALHNGRAAGSTEFHVFRPRPGLLPKYLLHFMFTPYVRRGAKMNMKGAAGQLRVPIQFFEALQIPLPAPEEQRRIVDYLDEQLSRLDASVSALYRVKTHLKRYTRSLIQSLTGGNGTSTWREVIVNDIAQSLDSMRKPVNKIERAVRGGSVPYLGANGRTGWIDTALFDEELVLVVEDETFVGRTQPFCYYFSGPCWVNNHTHVLRAKPTEVTAKYLNLALSYYPFIPLTTGSTGRRKLTKKALMSAPLALPSLSDQHRIVAEADRRLSMIRVAGEQVDINLARAGRLRQSILQSAFSS